MDTALKLLADASLELSRAEEAVADAAWTTARERLDDAGAMLAALRDAWPSLAPAHRAVVGPAGRQIRERLEAVERGVPRRTALVEVSAEPDPEQEIAPA